MGFYGNITNVSRTQFQFDKIYATRTSMEAHCSSDGVYPGRYVLIEYGSQDTHFKSIFLYKGIPYAALDPVDFKEEEEDNIINIYVPPTESKATYKVVDASYKAENEADLFIYKDELVSVPVGQRIFNVNEKTKFIKVLNYDQSDYGESTFNDFSASQDRLALFLKQQSIIEDDSEFEDKKYDKLADAYIINGKIIAPGYKGLQELGYPIDDMVWKIRPGCEYYRNEYTQYFSIDVSNSEMDEYGVFSNPVFKVMAGSGGDTFTNNFNIDRMNYKTSRGYDSTVWQKAYVEGKEKYVMVAELNTVVPTFDIVNDAPSLLPLTPHFDGNSTNVYYRLHWQPSWAIRMKSASPNIRGQRISQKGIFDEVASINLTTDTVQYPSDQDVTWEGVFYNTATNDVSEKTYSPYYSTWKEREEGEDERIYSIPAAIYYNKKGFDPTEVSYSSFIVDQLDPNTTNAQYDGAIKDSNWQPNEDRVGFFPTGLSGHMYNNHDSSLEGEAQVDTQEFVCMLPSIGNAISSMWDMVYGGRNTNDTIKYTLKRNLEMGWEDGKIIPTRKGLRLRGYSNGYQVGEVNTLVGAINSAHDLMGMIITPLEGTKEDNEKNISALSMDKIYFLTNENDYYRKQLQYDYEELSITTQADYDNARNNVFKEVSALRDFDKEILKTANGDYNPVYYQDYNNATDGDITKFDYIQETSYHPNRLYFELDEKTIDVYNSENSKLNTYEADKYFYHSLENDKDELILDSGKVAGNGRIYYEFDDYVNTGYKNKFASSYEMIKILPTDYNLYRDKIKYDEQTGAIIEAPIVPGYIHGIYKPNTYYYKSTSNGQTSYVLDSSPYKTQSIYYTIKADDPILPDDNSYRQLITYETVSDYSDLNPESDQYYYFGKTQADTLDHVSVEDLRNGQLQGAIPIRVVNSFQETEEAAYVFVENKNNNYKEFRFFKQVIQYVQNKEPSYSIALDPILLADFYPQAIYKPIFDEFTGKLIKLEFLKSDNIPVTVWRDMPIPGSEDLERTLVLEDEDGNMYKDADALYIFGEIVADPTNPAKGNKLLELSDIDKKPTQYYLKQCQGTFYQGGMYHYHPTNMGDILNKSYLLDTNLSGQYDDREFIDYYKISLEDISLKEDTYKIVSTSTYVKGQEYEGKNYYYKINNKYKPVVGEPANNSTVYTVEPSNDFYEPGKYYVQDAGDGSASANNHYTLVQSASMPEGKLYRKNGLYVTEDPNGVYPYGTEWNIDSAKLPTNLKLSVRTNKYGLVKIPQLARTDNTMHGLILRINQILEAGNTGVRDVSTVQGALNRLNDLIARIDKMKSGQFMIVDEYGRMHSADYSTAQEYVAINYGNNEITEYKNTEENKDIEDDRWIDLDVTPSYDKPTFTIKHNFTSVTSTTTTADLNDDAAGDGNNKGNADELELYTPIVDNTGHVVGKNIETVTLPYGFKHINTKGVDSINNADIYTTITTADNGANTSALTGTGNTALQADKTQDSLTINPANKWIQTKISPAGAGKNDTDALVIAHEIHAIDTVSRKTDLNNPAVNTITLQDTVYDAAGHLVENHTHEYTLPFGFKTITAANSDATSTGANTINNNNIIADSTQDTLVLEASNKWIKLDTNTADTVKFGHYAGGFTKGSANTEYGLSASKDVDQLDSENNFIVPNFKFDEAGHITSAENQTISLPENFTKIVTEVDTGTANNTAGSAGTIEANTLTDTLTLAEGNKWINIAADETSNKITFSHYVNTFNENNPETPVDFNDTGNSFTVVSDTVHDEAGHLTGVTNTTFILPNSLKTINIGAVNDSVEFATASNTAIVADSPRASMSINPGNRWITLTSNGSAMTINHAIAGAADSTKADGINVSQAPAFGETFNIPTFGIDQAGHISTIGTKTVALPSLPVLANSVLGGETAINAFNSQIINGVATNAVTFDKDSSTLISIINSLITRINELEATIAILHP